MKSSPGQSIMNAAQQREGLAEALGRVVAEFKAEFRKDLDRMEAENRALHAECRALQLELRGIYDQERQRIAVAIATMKNGAPGLPGKDGRDGVDGKDGEPGKDGRDGVDGKDGAPGADGVAGERGVPGERGEKGEAGDRGEKGEPGLIGKEGPEGKPGRDGRDGLGGLPGERGERGIDGKDGSNGIDGKDGAGFETWLVGYDEERTFKFSCGSGDRFKEFSFAVPFPLDRGVYKSDQRYQKGDEVNFGGHYWIAQCDTKEQPEVSRDWRMAMRKPRDGKDGKPGAKGDPGKEGPRGRDLTQMAPDGTKWT
jgi:Collagen triple helix repeat (20 copies)